MDQVDRMRVELSYCVMITFVNSSRHLLLIACLFFMFQHLRMVMAIDSSLFFEEIAVDWTMTVQFIF